MGKEVKITSIRFKKSNGEEVTLLFNEAKELYQQLHELFGYRMPMPSYPCPSKYEIRGDTLKK